MGGVVSEARHQACRQNPVAFIEASGRQHVVQKRHLRQHLIAHGLTSHEHPYTGRHSIRDLTKQRVIGSVNRVVG